MTPRHAAVGRIQAAPEVAHICTPTSAHTQCGTAARRTVCHPSRQGGRAAAAGHAACASGTTHEPAALLSVLSRPFQEVQWMGRPNFWWGRRWSTLVTGPAKALVRTGDLMSRRCSPSLFSQAGVSSAVHDLRRQQCPVPQLPGSVRRRSRRPQPAVRTWQHMSGKNGVFRQLMMGKRVELSARAVIVGDPPWPSAHLLCIPAAVLSLLLAQLACVITRVVDQALV